MSRKYLIIGASGAGMASAHTIRSIDAEGDITVLSAEGTPPYFRPMIPYVINGRKNETGLGLDGCGIFTREGIEVRLSCPAGTINTQQRIVTAVSGEQFFYDCVLFATGSRPYVPAGIEGLEHDGVFFLKTLADAVKIAERVRKTEHVVLLGGGILNLKGAFALLERGVKVTLAVYSPEVLSQLMEPEDAFLIRDALDKAGLHILTGVSATEILADENGVRGVILDDGTDLSCQMVCVGKGVVPNVDFLIDSGIALDHGILTDNYAACSLEDTYAAGDVAVTYDPGSGKRTVTGLWTNAVEMGICAGKNMAGRPTVYGGTLGIMNATQVAGVPIVSMGTVHSRGKALEVHRVTNDATLRKIVFSQDGTKMVGALFIGNIEKAGIYKNLIREQRDISGMKKELIDHTIHYGHFL